MNFVFLKNGETIAIAVLTWEIELITTLGLFFIKAINKLGIARSTLLLLKYLILIPLTSKNVSLAKPVTQICGAKFSSDKFFAEDVPEPPQKKGWF